MDKETLAWFEEQVRGYSAVESRYKNYAKVLEDVLNRMARPICPTAIVQVRAKGVPSFAGKILKRLKDYRHEDAVKKMTDLCGGRVIVNLGSEVDSLGQLIKDHFEIDWPNSMDTVKRLGSNQFGYRSVHYIVQFRNDGKGLSAGVPQEFLGLKAEIQVRTIAQHAWSDVGHDRLYKSAFKVPAEFEREAARIAALLESADEAFAHMVRGIDNLHTNVGRYMSEAEAKDEVDRLQVLRLHDKSTEVVERLARLLVSLGKWDEAIGAIEGVAGEKGPRLLTLLGLALCKKHRTRPADPAYLSGQAALEMAAAKDPDNVEALTHLAESWIGIRDGKVLENYRRAFEADPSDPRALAGYLRAAIVDAKDASVVSLVQPNIREAIRKCQAQADVGVNLPWAHYYMGLFHLLTDQPDEALAAYARGISHSADAHMVEEALDGVNALAALRHPPSATEWVRRMLRLAQAARFRSCKLDPDLEKLAGPPLPPGPVVLVAGGCDPRRKSQIEAFRPLVNAAFRDYRGTIVSGGTQEGVSGMVGEVTAESDGRIHSLGYLPAMLPADGTANRDTRYSDIRLSDGKDGFSAAEPLQTWIDLLRSGIAPSDVKLIAISGGPITAFECRLAAALGASVGIVRESGREADKLAVEGDGERMNGILNLPDTALALRAFLHRGKPGWIEADTRETLARLSHEGYREERRKSPTPPSDLALEDWGSLRENLKDSNRQQVDHIPEKLRAIGLKAVRVPEGTSPKIRRFTPDERERLAKMEHERWYFERVLAGWKPGPRNPATLTSPYLVEWDPLSEEVKGLDRQAVDAIPDLLARIGLEIRS